MSVVSAAAPIAETLTLIGCLTRANVEAITNDAALTDAALGLGVPSAALEAGMEGLRLALDDSLNIPVGEMFKAACLRLQDPDTEPLALTLAPMVVESTHHPVITARWAAVSLVLRLTVELSLEINGAQLLVEDGGVVGARTGATVGKVKVSVLSKDAAVVVGTPEFRLPGELRFARPATIARRR